MAWISHTAGTGTDLASLAGRQEGVLSRRQIEALGVSSRRVDLMVEDGRLLPIFHGVIALGHGSFGPRARMRAAGLACPGALISHRSAASLLGIGKTAPAVVDLIPLKQRGRAIDGVKAHLVPYPARHEWGYVRGIPVTGVARTIVDLAGVYGEKDLREAVERAATRRVLDIARIDAILADGRKRRGAPCLRRVIDDWRPVAETVRYSTVRSLFEARLMPLIAAANLPLPRMNAPVRTAHRTLEVDLLWDHARFVVEADGRKHHGIEAAFERDHKRTRELIAAGYAVLGVTWREAEREPDAVLAVIQQQLASRTPGAATKRGPTLPT